MSRVLYLEAPFGISGDMLAGALLDLGADYGKVQQVLGSLELAGFQTKVSRVQKAGLDMCDFLVELDASHENHDHDMEYLHGHSHSVEEHDHDHHQHSHEHGHTRHGDHEHEHHHEHLHDDHGHHYQHEHRGLPEIEAILAKGCMSDKARSMARKIFHILAQAEAKAHGKPMDEVHFHEVGAIDSIVDIVTIAVCLDDLQLDDVVVGTLTDGTGTIRCQHGIMAVPVPAVTNIVTQQGLRLQLSQIQGELVTPTGAAAAAAIRTKEELPKSYRIIASGMGAGKRSYSVESFLRLLLLEADTEGQQDEIIKLEANIDDSNGEALGLAMEKLLEAGAKDVFFTPIIMKKNRPAYLLSLICSEEQAPRMEELIFHHTSTIGIRRQRMERTIMTRQIIQVEVAGVRVPVKVCAYGGESKCYPEYTGIRELQDKTGWDYQTAYSHIQLQAINSLQA